MKFIVKSLVDGKEKLEGRELWCCPLFLCDDPSYQDFVEYLFILHDIEFGGSWAVATLYGLIFDE